MTPRLLAVVLIGVGCAGSGAGSRSAVTDQNSLAPTSLAAKCGYRMPGSQKVHLTADASHVNREPTKAEIRTMRSLMNAAARVRNLPLKTPVAIRVQNQAAIRYYLNSQIKEADLQEANALYGSLGLLDNTDGLGALLLDVLSEQVVGYYDPEHHYLVVRDDVLAGLFRNSGPALDEANAVLIHELVHALQDQHLSLGTLHKQERSADADGAFQSLVEGDATLGMLSYLADRVGVTMQQFTQDLNVLRAVLAAAPMNGMPSDELSRSPRILQTLLLSPYVDGLVFAATLYRDGGWPAINAAYRHMPTTTAQVLHPHLFLRRDRSSNVTLPAFPQRLPGGYTLAYTDSLGELAWRVYAAQATTDQNAARAAQGLVADRIGVYKSPHRRLAAAWLGLCRNAEEARELEHAADAAHAASLPPECRAANGVQRRGHQVLVSRALTDDAQQVLQDRLLATAN